MDHPAIERTRRTGYPYSERRQMFVTDGLGNDVHSGDEILEFDGEFYLVDELSVDAREILEKHGADYVTAK
ncbi:hypothetical protein BN997_01080 [Oceanobacillus oncorhynchi]|uniref:Uncharacterized protein n=1 Tax=Oceanobacillus oncorhynchi TaxID=545501 RepID=A0A0A1MNN6_9BACI|nr:hypothetical protein [Oceanobacillus oncorhynchi]CEI81262.1 hypothetical protein BN997_01080 [Oceanobacillus oncorhynchi]